MSKARGLESAAVAKRAEVSIVAGAPTEKQVVRNQLDLPTQLSRKQDRTLSRIGGSAPHPVWMFVRSRVGGGSAPPASELHL